MQVGSRIKLTIKLNAQSTDPISGQRDLNEMFRLIKRNTHGTVEALSSHNGIDYAVVKLEGLRTRQEIRADLLKVVV